jgi:hypothetical protein
LTGKDFPMAWINGPALLLQAPTWPMLLGSTDSGPWQNVSTGKFYCALTYYDPVAGDRYFRIYRADDSATSPWVSVLDLPNYRNGGTPTFGFDPSTGIITAYYPITPSGYRLGEFDTNTESWTTLASSGGPTAFSYLQVQRCADGSTLLAYNGGSPAHTLGQRYASGWGAVFDIASVSAPPLGTAADGSIVYVLYREAASTTAKIARVLADNTIDWTVTVANWPSLPSYLNNLFLQLHDGPPQEFVVGSADKTWTGPVAADATFTEAPVLGVPAGGTSLDYSRSIVRRPDGVVWQIWNVQVVTWVGEVATLTFDGMYARQYLGGNAWGADQVGIDFVEHPPDMPPAFTPPGFPDGPYLYQYSHAQWTTRGSNAGFGIICDFLVNDTNLTCTIFFSEFDAIPEVPPVVTALRSRTCYYKPFFPPR